MTILELIEKLEKQKTKAERNALLKKYVPTNWKIQSYLNMIFGEHSTKFVDKIPKFATDPDTPNGLHYSNLERNVEVVKRIFFDPNFGQNRERTLVRILENIAPEEVEVIKAIVSGKWKHVTMKFYQEELVPLIDFNRDIQF